MFGNFNKQGMHNRKSLDKKSQTSGERSSLAGMRMRDLKRSDAAESLSLRKGSITFG
jgi:hypothetical protein